MVKVLSILIRFSGRWYLDDESSSYRSAGNRLSMLAMALAIIVACAGMELVSLMVLTLFFADWRCSSGW